MFASASSAVEFRCENADPDAVVEADRDQLGQVLLNLCINAQDSLRGRPGRVMVRIRRTALHPETAARLEDQDINDVSAEVLYATYAMQLYCMPDAELQIASFNAYNQWLV